MILNYNKPFLIDKLMREFQLAGVETKIKLLTTIGNQIKIETILDISSEDLATLDSIVESHNTTPDAFLSYKAVILAGQPIGAEIVAEFGANNMVSNIPRAQMASFASQFIVIQNLLTGGSLGLAKDAINMIPEGSIPADVKSYFLDRISKGITLAYAKAGVTQP